MEIKIDLTHLLNEDSNIENDVTFKIENLDDSMNYKFDVDDSGFSVIITKEKL